MRSRRKKKMPELSNISRPSKDWRDEAAQLPPFYSPQSKASHSHDDVDVVPLDSDRETRHNRRLGTDDDDAAATLAQPPPPSLLSPSFTPPATPGTSTPLTSVSSTSGAPRPADLESEPKGIPVDSSVPTGGCGTKRPRLLETLPEVECIVRARIPTVHGTQMFLHLYKNNVDSKEHLAIVFGDRIRSQSLDAPREGETEMDRLVRGAYVGRLFPGRTTSAAVDGMAEASAAAANPEQESAVPPLVRIHSECYTGETVWSARCDCGEQLDEAAHLMANTAGGGIIVYLRQEGRGIGLGEKLKAYNLQDLGSDTVQANLLLRHPADARSYGLATAMLQDLGLHDIRLLTNNPDKIRAVEGPNREIVVKQRVAMVPKSWKHKDEGFISPEVNGYLRTKVCLLFPPLACQCSSLIRLDRKNGPLVGFGRNAAVADGVHGSRI